MKKKLLILFVIIELCTTVGCVKKNEMVDISKINTIAEYEYSTTTTCEAFDKGIKYFNYSNDKYWLVTENNDAYVYSTNKLYSNNTNCKKIDGKFDDIIFIDRRDDSNQYHDKYDGREIYYNSKFQKVSIDTDNYSIVKNDLFSSEYDSMLSQFTKMKENGYIKYRKANFCTAFATKGDNNLYILRLYYYDYITTLDNEKIIFSAPKNEKIIDFYYSSDAHANKCIGETYYEGEITNDMDEKYILTDKSYYRPLLVNEEECKKYADVECIYEWQKDEELSKFSNDILYRNDFVLITRNGRVYYNSNYMVD